MRENLMELIRKGIEQGNSTSNVLQSLRWRDRYCGAMYFRETIQGRELAIQQLKNGECTGLGTGAAVWPAACVLMKYLEFQCSKDPTFLQKKNVIELGSGTGCVGIAAAMMGASVLLTDQYQLQDLLHINRDLCLRSQTKIDPESLRICQLDWEKDSQVDIEPDFILISDCVLPKLYPIQPLVDTISQLCKTTTTRVIMAYEDRYFEQYDAKERFIELMRNVGFQYQLVDPIELHPKYAVDDIQVWQLTREK